MTAKVLAAIWALIAAFLGHSFHMPGGPVVNVDPAIVDSVAVMESDFDQNGAPIKGSAHQVFLNSKLSSRAVTGTPKGLGSAVQVGIDETSRTFKNPDGTYVGQYYGAPHFAASQGVWYELDYSTSTSKIVPNLLSYIVQTAMASTFNTSVHSTVEYDGPQATWGNMTGAATGSSVNAGTSDYVYAHSLAALYDELDRNYEGFDTSSIPAGSTILTASLAVQGNFKATLVAPALNVYSWAPNTPGSVVIQDFSLCGSTQFSTTIAYASFNDAGQNTFAFNASGIAGVSPGASTYICLREVNYDVANSAPGTPGGSATLFYMRWDSSTGAVPQVLTVTFTPPSSGNSIQGLVRSLIMF